MTQEGNSLRERTHAVVSGVAGRKAKAFDLVVIIAILLSVTAAIWESLLSDASIWGQRLWYAEIGFTLLFTVEYLVRLWSCPRPLRYAFSPIGIIDFVGIFPTYLLLIYPEFGAFAFVRILRVLRVLRIFALGRIARATNVILKALIAARYKIAVFAALVAVVVLVAGALMYAIEGPEGGFTNIPLATYWAVATLTTVGHPDLFPVTTTGQILASVLMVLGYGFIAVSVGVITSEVVVLQQAHTELLGAEESERLEYKASAFYSYQNPDIPESVMFRTSILKPTAGFLNAKGGTLVIGMSDDGNVVGVQKDLELKQWNIDQYVNRITDRIASNLGEFAAAMTTISVVPEGDQHLCLLEIARSPDPVYLKGKQSPVFYARINNSTRELSGPSLVSYVQKRWN